MYLFLTVHGMFNNSDKYVIIEGRDPSVTVSLLLCTMYIVGKAPSVPDGHELKNVHVVAPDIIELQCQIDLGNPTAQVRWYRNKRHSMMFSDITNDSRYVIKTDAEMQSLIIPKSHTSDSATYRCEAINKFGKVRTVCRVAVLRKF